MKTIKFAILAFLLGCSIYSLNAQVKVTPNGETIMGNPTSPALTVNPNGTVNIGKTDNSQLMINEDGVVSIGKTGDPQLRIYEDGGVKIGNASGSIFNNSTYFDLDIPMYKSAVIRQLVAKTVEGYTIDIGFEFVPLFDRGFIGLNNTKHYMALTGLSDGGASIGTYNNQMYKTYSQVYYTSGSNLGLVSTSDIRLKTNIRKLSSISERILKLNPVTYDFIKSGSGRDVSKDSNYKNRTGFIAQEVKEIFPDLVVMNDEDSLYSLDYAGLIPYLTKALQEQSQVLQEQAQNIQKQDELMLAQDRINKEQSVIIEKLQQQINDIQQGIYTADFIIDGETSQPNKSPQQQTNGTDNALYQNTPNPFNISTTIKYQLSDNVTNAKICIYNLTGKQLQCHNLPVTNGESSIEVRASSLQAGMYLYSLIVDDKLIDTKRMVLTE